MIDPTSDPVPVISVAALVKRANDRLTRYSGERDYRDLEDSLAAARQAVAQARSSRDVEGRDDARAAALNALSAALTAAFQRERQPAVMHEAVARQREAVDACPADSAFLVPLSVNLAHRLVLSYELDRDPARLDEAVDLLEPICAGDSPPRWRAAALNNLGLALRARFDADRRPADLAGSLAAQRTAADLTGEAGPESADRLNNLGNARWAVYLAHGVIAELDLAIEAYEGAVLAAQSAHQRGACLLGLGSACWARWSRLRRPNDLSQALDALLRAADEFGDDEASKAHCALNLGVVFFARWREHRNPADLGLAIDEWSRVRAIDGVLLEVVDAATGNLGAALWERFERFGAVRDLDDAITLLSAAQRGERATLRPGRLFTLAGARARRYEREGGPRDAADATDAYRAACVEGLRLSPGVALSAGQLWGRWALSRGAYGEADEALSLATAAALTLYRRQRVDRHVEVWLGQATGLAAAHAYVQIKLGRVPQAALSLERGRALLLSAALDPSAPERPLRRRRPEEATGVTTVS